jgi:hypothetical protein
MEHTMGRATTGIRTNRIVVLCYRAVAFVLCLIGLLDTTGVLRGTFNSELLLFYTTDSNILVLIVFGILIVKTIGDIREKGSTGPSSHCERLCAIVSLAITVTMVLFWLLLTPTIEDPAFLFSYMNLQIHLLTPLLMLFDFFVFTTPGKFKRQDPWFFALIPLAYFGMATVIGFAGYTYHVSTARVDQHFPYFFIDFDVLGAGVFIYVIVISLVFVALAYLLFLFDRRRGRRLEARSTPRS